MLLVALASLLVLVLVLLGLMLRWLTESRDEGWDSDEGWLAMLREDDGVSEEGPEDWLL